MNRLSGQTDLELVELFKQGSQAAFEELYMRYKDPLFYYCKKYLHDETEAEDIVQDIFLQLWVSRDTLQIASSFSGYIYTVAYHSVLQLLRQFNIHSRYAQYILIHAKEETNETEDAIIDKDYTVLFNQMMEQLSPKQKEVFRLSRIEGYTYKQIAEVMHLSVETVQEHASLALKKIKKQLIQHADIHFQVVILCLILFF